MNVALWLWSSSISKQDFVFFLIILRFSPVAGWLTFFLFVGTLFRFNLCTWSCRAKIRSLSFFTSPTFCVRCWVKCCFSSMHRSRLVFSRSCSKIRHVRSVSSSYNFLSNSSTKCCWSSVGFPLLFGASFSRRCCSSWSLTNWISFFSSSMTIACSLISTACKSSFSWMLKLVHRAVNERRIHLRLTSRCSVEHFLVWVSSLHSKHDHHPPVWALFSCFLPVSSSVDRDRLSSPFSTCVSLVERSNRLAKFAVLLTHRRCTIAVRPSTVDTVFASASSAANAYRELFSVCWSDRRGWSSAVERWSDDRSECESSSSEIPRPAATMKDRREQEAKRHVSCVKTHVMIWTNDEV